MIATRNRLAHGYDAIENKILWEITTLHLPRLVVQLESYLKPSTH